MLAMDQVIEEGRSWPSLDKFDGHDLQSILLFPGCLRAAGTRNKVVDCFYIKEGASVAVFGLGGA